MGDVFEQFRLSLVQRPGHLFSTTESIPSRDAFIRDTFRRRWEFEHYKNTFHFVPDERTTVAPVILGRLGRPFESDENLAPENDLEATVHYGWKAAVVIVDPREHGDGQKVLMNHDQLVGNPLPLLSSLIRHINTASTLATYTLAIDPIFDEASFFAFAQQNRGDITQLTFDLSVPNMFGGTDNLSQWLRDLREQERAQAVTLRLKSTDGINTDTPDIREGVEYAMKGAGRVKAKTRKGKRFDSKNRVKKVALDRKDKQGTLLQRVARQLTRLVPL